MSEENSSNTVELQLDPNGVFSKLFASSNKEDVKETESFITGEEYQKLIAAFTARQQLNNPKNKLRRAIKAKEEERLPAIYKGLKKGFLN